MSRGLWETVAGTRSRNISGEEIQPITYFNTCISIGGKSTGKGRLKASFLREAQCRREDGSEDKVFLNCCLTLVIQPSLFSDRGVTTSESE